MSGPASGVMAAAATLGGRAGFANAITYDMGGTSTDVALIRGGVPAVSSELELEYGDADPRADGRRAHRRRRRRLDRLGSTRPACCRSGRRAPARCRARSATAAAARGRPSPTPISCSAGSTRSGLLAVDRPVPLAAVARCSSREVGAPLGLDAEEAAAADRADRQRPHGGRHPHGVARARPRPARLRALRLRRRRPAARGRDRPRARHPDASSCPARPGITNALGCVVADLRHDFVRTVNAPLEALATDGSPTILAEQVEQGRSALAREGVAVGEVAVLHRADMQFRGQTHLLNVAGRRREPGPGRRCAGCSSAPTSTGSGSSCRRSAPSW